MASFLVEEAESRKSMENSPLLASVNTVYVYKIYDEFLQ